MIPGSLNTMMLGEVAAAPSGSALLWNAADAAAFGDMVLTSGDAAAATTGGFAFRNLRSTISKSTGKWYFEVINETTDDIQGFSIRLANAAMTAYGFSPDHCMGMWDGFWCSSSAFTNTVSPSPWVTNPIGTVYAVAIDFDAEKIWVAKDNTYLSGSPASGTSPTVTFNLATTGALFPAGLFFRSAVGRWKLQGAVSGTTYSPPSGFVAWG